MTLVVKKYAHHVSDIDVHEIGVRIARRQALAEALTERLKDELSAMEKGIA